MQLITIVAFVVLYVLAMVSTATSGYYLMLAVIASRSRPRCASPNALARIAIIIPAHNEERGIRATLRSCHALDYPSTKFAVVVIADNCTDRTATIARQSGFECLERFDETQRGKGAALAWAFQNLEPRAFDIYVIVDADCTLDKTALQWISGSLHAGYDAMQCLCLASNVDDSSISYISAIGNYVETKLFYTPKAMLNQFVLLRGTGMAISRQALARVPWSVTSSVEDTEYTLLLCRAGINVRLITEACVCSDYPSTLRQLTVQRARWIGGNWKSALVDGSRFLTAGLFYRNGTWVDVGWTMIVKQRALVVAVVMCAAVGSAIAMLTRPSMLSSIAALLAGTAVACQLVVFMSAVIQIGLSRRRVILLLGTPVVVLAFLVIAVRSIVWNRSSWMPRINVEA